LRSLFAFFVIVLLACIKINRKIRVYLIKGPAYHINLSYFVVY
jgi:hypothetical protein